MHSSDTDVFLANGVATFFSQLGGTIAILIGNAFILNALSKYICCIHNLVISLALFA